MENIYLMQNQPLKEKSLVETFTVKILNTDFETHSV